MDQFKWKFHGISCGEKRAGRNLFPTADIFREKDDFSDGELVDYILDSAGQKGTGRWTSLESLKQGVNVSMITAACNARIMSNRVEERNAAREQLEGPGQNPVANKKSFQEMVRQGLYAAKIVAYAQGFFLLSQASKEYGWDLDYGKTASIFRAGCIIQAEFRYRPCARPFPIWTRSGECRWEPI